MKKIKNILMILLVVLVGIQFIPTKRNQSNSVPVSDFMAVYNVPEQIETKIKTSCYDCHSNNTKYPWYSQIQPGAWFMQNHINKGKKELNFNEWADYSDRRKTSKLKSIISQIKDDEMPLASYTFIHRDAVFSESDKEEIIQWITKFRESL